MWQGSITELRLRYLFPLANLCNCPPPMTYELRVIDFAVLLRDIDAYQAEMARAAQG